MRPYEPYPVSDRIADLPWYERVGLLLGIFALAVFVIGTIADAGTVRPWRPIAPPSDQPAGTCLPAASGELNMLWAVPASGWCATPGGVPVESP